MLDTWGHVMETVAGAHRVDAEEQSVRRAAVVRHQEDEGAAQ
jgi:hypothetical protein